MARFERIARDLEKLPCELHDPILADLEFQQLIRLSGLAGPRLTWSLENSQASWSLFFRGEGHALHLRRLLVLTDLIKKRCFKLPKAKSQDFKWSPNACDLFEYVSTKGPLAFLYFRKSDWLLKARDRRLSNLSQSYIAPINDNSTLCRHWLYTLNEIAIDTTWKDLHADYSWSVAPWIDQIEGASEVFGRIPYIGSETPYPPHYSNLVDAKREAMTIDELEDFVEMYQRLRIIKAGTFAKELCSLADLYEAHPTVFKMPFAPESPRSNLKHIPDSMRREAGKMKKRAANTWWRYKEMNRYRFAYPFPAIIPYQWSVQLFHKLMQEGGVIKPPWAINMSRNTVLQSRPRWAKKVLGPLDKDQAAHRGILSGDSKLDPNSWRRQHEYRPHTQEELKWLGAFAEVVDWIGEQYPGKLREVRDPELGLSAMEL